MEAAVHSPLADSVEIDAIRLELRTVGVDFVKDSGIDVPHPSSERGLIPETDYNTMPGRWREEER